jgi:hypothetical protein
VPVEKLFRAKIAKTKLRQDALSAILSNFKAFCTTQIRVFSTKTDFFNRHAMFQQLLTSNSAI